MPTVPTDPHESAEPAQKRIPPRPPQPYAGFAKPAKFEPLPKTPAAIYRAQILTTLAELMTAAGMPIPMSINLHVFRYDPSRGVLQLRLDNDDTAAVAAWCARFNTAAAFRPSVIDEESERPWRVYGGETRTTPWPGWRAEFWCSVEQSAVTR